MTLDAARDHFAHTLLTWLEHPQPDTLTRLTTAAETYQRARKED